MYDNNTARFMFEFVLNRENFKEYIHTLFLHWLKIYGKFLSSSVCGTILHRAILSLIHIFFVVLLTNLLNKKIQINKYIKKAILG